MGPLVQARWLLEVGQPSEDSPFLHNLNYPKAMGVREPCLALMSNHSVRLNTKSMTTGAIFKYKKYDNGSNGINNNKKSYTNGAVFYSTYGHIYDFN